MNSTVVGDSILIFDTIFKDLIRQFFTGDVLYNVGERQGHCRVNSGGECFECMGLYSIKRVSS